jgi:hypothetical protein
MPVSIRSILRSTRNGLVTGVVAFAVFGAASAALGASPWQNRPFLGDSTGTTTITGAPAPGVFTATSAGTINATHIGNGTYEMETTQDYIRHVELPDPSANNCAFIEGTITIQAANGDQIDGAVDPNRSVSCVAVETPGPGADAGYLSTLYIEVTGGTGRFEDATGWFFSRGTSSAQTDPPGASFDDAGVVLGDIDY